MSKATHGVFYDGYKSAMSESPRPAERSMQTVKPKTFRPETAQSRLIYPASNVNTAINMRKPL